MFDWLNRHFIDGGGLPAGHDRTAYIEKGGDGPFGECEWTPPVGPGEVYF